ncbi:carbohydrate kinase [Jatrophihabitans sp.]|uniref:carbohydrate kinase family protein n=1 Tax=Jatrophihabitans sp. TaxID=1932789 RepID=UPI0030C68F9D|nr:Ribokinase [Jatrophihabitans sp.]
MTSYLVVGEALVDVIVGADGTLSDHPGGSPANVAYGLGQLGDDVTLLTELGDDPYGRMIAGHLAAAGVTVRACPATATSTARARLRPDGSALYDFDVSWDIDVAGAPATDLLHTGSIGALLAPGADAVRALVTSRRPQTLISLDPNIRPALLDTRESVQARLDHLVMLSDVVKISDEDLRWLYPERDPGAVAQAWHTDGTPLVAVTRGADGVTAYFAGTRIDVPPAPAQVVDTVGAGDSFMAALLDALVRAMSGTARRSRLAALTPAAVRGVLEWAATAAALTVSRAGAALPTRSEIDEAARH